MFVLSQYSFILHLETDLPCPVVVPSVEVEGKCVDVVNDAATIG